MRNTAPDLPGFAAHIAAWQREAGRKGLPWQATRDPYRIWLSEIMLQQTQVATVIGYYERFLERFPTVQALAQAEQAEVMPYWAGLGYYARARNLHRCAQQLCADWQGRFPPDAADIASLPGIGPSTAAAIAAFAYGQRAPIMDGNVKRVFARYFGIYGNPAARATEQLLWDTAHQVLQAAPQDLDMTAYTQGLMDLGAGLCTRSRPACSSCPLSGSCYAQRESRQHELPEPKPRKKPSERACHMLILECADAVLLEQRPAPGIWAGLWSLPQFDTREALQQACQNWGQPLQDRQRMAGLEHVFTHFKLHITPWQVTCPGPLAAQPLPQQAWIPLTALPDTALPAPVRKLLLGLYPAADLFDAVR